MKLRWKRGAGWTPCLISLLILTGVPEARASESERSASPAPSKCTTLLVGVEASADGSVLLAHNEDLGEYAAQHYLTVPKTTHATDESVLLWSGAEVPQVEETLAYTASSIFDIDYVPGDITSGINEYQVSVANNLAPQRDAVEPYPTEGRILWTELTRLALERAHSARDAVEIIGDLVHTYRLASDPGTLFGISDPQEAWWIEITQEGQWAAARVEDFEASVRTNAYRLGELDLSDPERFLASDDVISYAVSMGWYSEAEGEFNFARVYGRPAAEVDPANTHREQRLNGLLEPLVPSVTVEDLMDLLRDHYEGTDWDLTTGGSSPHHTAERTVCRMSTEVSVVCQSRGYLPPDVGALCFRAMTTPCSSLFTPWYLGQNFVPEPYEVGSNERTPESAYWAFRQLSEVVDVRYGSRIGPVQNSFDAMFQALRTEQQQVELMALAETDPLRARELLTSFANSRAMAAFQTAEQLRMQLLKTRPPSSILSHRREMKK